MKKLIIIALMAIATIGSIEVKAQYVEKVGTAIFIDVQDMPNGTFMTISLNRSFTELSGYNSLYYRFEVAKSDEPTTMAWSAAMAACAAKGTGWRLPTQKELMLMRMLKDMLIMAGSNAFSTIYYWSICDISANLANSSAVRLEGEGMADSFVKSTPHSVRCIRET